jgi:hypothetical protein
VAVFVSSMWDIQDEFTRPVQVPEFLPSNLRWANSWNFRSPQPKLENDAPLHKSRISAGIGRFCDLGFVAGPETARRYFSEAKIRDDRKDRQDAQFQFAFETLPTSRKSPLRTSSCARPARSW